MPKQYDVAGAAEQLGLSTSSIYSLVRDGSLPHLRTGPDGKLIRFRQHHLDAYLESCERSANPVDTTNPAMRLGVIDD